MQREFSRVKVTAVFKTPPIVTEFFMRTDEGLIGKGGKKLSPFFVSNVTKFSVMTDGGLKGGKK